MNKSSELYYYISNKKYFNANGARFTIGDTVFCYLGGCKDLPCVGKIISIYANSINHKISCVNIVPYLHPQIKLDKIYSFPDKNNYDITDGKKLYKQYCNIMKRQKHLNEDIIHIHKIDKNIGELLC